MQIQSKRWLYAVWILVVLAFAILHAFNLSADFPNHSPWYSDWAKYTDEGWYGNAAVRAHVLGTWYIPGDFNPAVALPVLPFLEWLLFFITGVSLQAARGLAVALFFINLCLTYWLLRARGPRWAGLLAVTLLVTSPFLYCFSRLAILEPPLTAFTLLALNLAVRLPHFRRKVAASIAIGLLFTVMMLTKTTAVFLLPALGWALLLPLRKQPRQALRCAFAAAASSACTYGLWLATVFKRGLFPDFRYLFFINAYPKPKQLDWPLFSLWWSFHGGLWVGHILIPLAGWIVLAAILGYRSSWGRSLIFDPLFGASALAVAGYILFMTVQYHPQPRYFSVVAFFCFILLAQGAASLLHQPGTQRKLGWAVIALTAISVTVNAAWTLSYASYPEYSFITAAQQLTRYIAQHPNGNRMLVSVSGDEIMLATHLPALCDDFGTLELPRKLAAYRPGWFATWNDLDPGTLADLHTHFSLEQVASFRAFDDPERNVLILFKLHPLPNGKVRDQHDQNLQIQLPEDKFDADVE